MGLNAGAAAGFDSHQISVGPQLILMTETDDGLAFILGHEIAHVTQGHTRTLAVQELVVGTLRLATMLAVAVAEADSCRRGGYCPSDAAMQQDMQVAGAATGLVAHGTATATGYGRDQEREADYYGLQYAAAAGYRPQAGVAAFRRLLALETGSGSSFKVPFLSDHPATAERIVRLEKWANEARVRAAPAEEVHVAPTGAPEPHRAVDRLRVVEQLRREGLISGEEHSRLRRSILDGL